MATKAFQSWVGEQEQQTFTMEGQKCPIKFIEESASQGSAILYSVRGVGCAAAAAAAAAGGGAVLRGRSSKRYWELSCGSSFPILCNVFMCEGAW